MEILFWAAAGLLAYTYGGYPLILWAWGTLSGRTSRKQPFEPKVTLLIAAYNEEKVIAQKLENSLSLDYPHEKLEIVVASESTDNTNTIVQGFAPQGIILRAFPERVGKAAMLHVSVPDAGGEIVVFSDANAFYERDALRKLVSHFADERIGCVSGQLEFDHYKRNPTKTTEALYWKYEAWVKRLESRLFSLLGANGSIFALRKELYAPLSPTRGDDFELPVRVLLQGYGVVLEPEAISREKPTETTSTEFRRRIRIVSGMFTSAWFLAGEAVRRRAGFVLLQLLSHKFLRWLSAMFLLLLLASSAALAGPFYQGALGLQALFYGLALVGWLLDVRGNAVPMLFHLPYYFCAIHVAATWGVAKALISPPPPVWKQAR